MASLLVLTGLSQGYTLSAALTATNKARTNPSYYSTFINTNYKAKTVNGVQTDWYLEFNEATPAVFDGAITYLNSFTPVGTLTLDMGMTFAAWRHAKYLGETLKSLSHTGECSSAFYARMNVFTTKIVSASAENIISNRISAKAANIEYMIADFLIDDGVSTRGHRTNLMNSAYTKVGLGIYKAGDGTEYFVMMFASSFTCDKCTLTCDQQDEIGWTQYLIDNSLTSNNCPNTCKSTYTQGNCPGGAVSTASDTGVCINPAPAKITSTSTGTTTSSGTITSPTSTTTSTGTGATTSTTQSAGKSTSMSMLASVPWILLSILAFSFNTL